MSSYNGNFGAMVWYLRERPESAQEYISADWLHLSCLTNACLHIRMYIECHLKKIYIWQDQSPNAWNIGKQITNFSRWRTWKGNILTFEEIITITISTYSNCMSHIILLKRPSMPMVFLNGDVLKFPRQFTSPMRHVGILWASLLVDFFHNKGLLVKCQIVIVLFKMTHNAEHYKLNTRSDYQRIRYYRNNSIIKKKKKVITAKLWFYGRNAGMNQIVVCCSLSLICFVNIRSVLKLHYNYIVYINFVCRVNRLTGETHTLYIILPSY